ncbi:MAG TPA: hypothetical protein DCS79_06740 [Gammaproteobacteria bacterium]|nr:hypothetical protein [Gammaproteobacteria bacterium]
MVLPSRGSEPLIDIFGLSNSDRVYPLTSRTPSRLTTRYIEVTLDSASTIPTAGEASLIH